MWNGICGVIQSHRCDRENSAVILKRVITDGHIRFHLLYLRCHFLSLSGGFADARGLQRACEAKSHLFEYYSVGGDVVCWLKLQWNGVRGSHAPINRISFRLLAKKSIFRLFV